MSAINKTALDTALGAFNRANKNILIRKMLLGSSVARNFEIMDGVKDELAMPTLSISDLVKPGNNTTFQPSVGALAFGARIGKVRSCKVDLLIDPMALEKTWLGYLYAPGSRSQSMPLEAFIMDYVAQKIQENMELQATWRGVYNAAGTTPIDVMNGMLKLIADEITATTVAPIVTGAVTSANVVSKILAVYDGIGEAYKAQPTDINVSSTIFDWYTRQFNVVLNANLVATADAAGNVSGVRNNEFPVSGTNATLVRTPGMGTSQRIICTPKTNKVFLCDVMGEENNIEIQRFERSLKLLIDFKAGVQLKEVNADALAVNDQV